VSNAFKPLTFLFEKLEKVVGAQVANLELNKTEVLRQSIENWKTNPQYVSKDLSDLRLRNKELEEQMQGIDKQLQEKDLEIQRAKFKSSYGIDIFSKL
jgi:predicted  nucleic acid-binding Zn-ribbon protein